MSPVLLGLFAAAALLPQAKPVTFSEDVAPIVYNNCVTCHRPGEAAPFSLISYEDVKKRGALISTVTKSRYMPPWHAAHDYGEFKDERRLTDEQIATIASWVQQGMPEGDPAKMPRLPQFTEGWHLGKPDLILEMPAGFDVPASGADVFRNFTIPVNITEDKWVRAVEFRPSARKAAHHALFAYIPAGSTSRLDGADGKPGFGGMGNVGVNGQGSSGSLGGWAVGGIPVFLPDGLALPLPKGSDFLLQMHFHPTGKPEMEKSVIGIYFADKQPDRRLLAIGLPAVFGFGAGIDIPPGEKNYTIQGSFTLPVDVRVFSAAAHAHYLAKEMKTAATLPDGSAKPLIWIQDWDFNWQEVYGYKEPFLLPKGTRIDTTIRYDNSADNPRNPSNPPKRAQFGEQSFDEMGTVGLMVAAVRKEDEAPLQRALSQENQSAIQKGVADGTARRFLANQALRRPAPPAPRTQITLFDKQGKALRTVAEPGVYNQAAISPDGSRVAVIRNDRTITDVWVFDVEGGKATPVTADPVANTSPVWSHDGKQIAYVSVFSDENYSAIYRKAADGSGKEELIYKHTPGSAVVITDWSADGVLCFWSGDAMYALPVNGDRKPIELVNDKFSARGGRFSPDGKFIAYSSNESGRFEVYVAPVHLPSPLANPIQVSKNGGLGGIAWRQDGKELYYMAFPGVAEMGVDITTSPDFHSGTPRLLVQPQGGVSSPAQLSNVATPDGERFVFLPQRSVTAPER
jgi:hypothetical protein